MSSPRFRPVDKTKGPWLIWSHYWSSWHRRSADGGACGYTDDIAHAGVFDFANPVFLGRDDLAVSD